MMRDPFIVRKKLSRLVMMSLVYSSFSAKRDKILVKFEYSSAIFVINIYVLSHKEIMVDTFFKLMFMSVVLTINTPVRGG